MHLGNSSENGNQQRQAGAGWGEARATCPAGAPSLPTSLGVSIPLGAFCLRSWRSLVSLGDVSPPCCDLVTQKWKVLGMEQGCS